MADAGTPFVSSTFSRVTSNLTRSVILTNIQRSEKEIMLAQEQLATGLRIVRPSMDPVGANRAMDFQVRINRSEQFLRNISASSHRMTMSDVSMENANELINRARVIALGQVQSTATPETRRLAAQEVNELLKQAVNIANTRFEDKFLFAGSKNTSAPFAFVGGAVVFNGNGDNLATNVSEGMNVASNVRADDAFGVFSEGIKGTDLATQQTIDLDPALTSATKISALGGGDGISMGSISVTGSGTSVVDLSIAESVGDIVDLINAQTATTGVTASINAALNGLQLVRAGGGTIVVDEVSGGKTAANLGVWTGSAGTASPLVGGDLDPAVTAKTLLGDLYGGAGIEISGITIANVTADGSFNATLSSASFGLTSTVESLLNAINGSGTYVFAHINDAGTGIDINSRLSGGRLTVAEATGTGSSAAQLGILSTLNRSKLSDLNNGLGVDSVDGYDLRIVRKDGGEVFIDVDNADTVQDIVNAIDNDPLLLATINASGMIEVTDSSVGAGDLRIENYNGSYAATNLGIEGSVPNTVGSITLSGTALTYVGVQPEGLFTSLVNLRTALLGNNPDGISSAQRLLDVAQNRLLGARADIGARMAELDMTQNRLDYENTELQKMLSEVKDADIAEVATRLQMQQTILQAGLAVAARIMQTSLLNYL